MFKTYKNITKGFTLVELLIVIAVLGVLAVALLTSLNPAEIQKKARDTKRMQDLRTLEAIYEQAVNDSRTDGCFGYNCYSWGRPAGNEPCSSSWLVANVCQYVKSVPTDPNNSTYRNFVSGSGTTATLYAAYYAAVSYSDYEVMVRQESKSNDKKVLNDGGNSPQWVEAGSNLDLYGN